MNPDTTNFEKFQTANPVVRHLIKRFFSRVRCRVGSMSSQNMLDAGCGEGMSLFQLRDLLPESVKGFDINSDCVAYTAKQFPDAGITQEDIFKLPYEDAEFDLVICFEVMEHLPRPEDALRALKRVANKRIIITVPHEPWFQLGSLCRGKYLKTWGNHPEHINHWSPRSFEKWLREEFNEVEVETSFPWIIAEVRV